MIEEVMLGVNVTLTSKLWKKLWTYHNSLPLTRSHAKRVREIERERCIDIRTHSDKHTHTHKHTHILTHTHTQDYKHLGSQSVKRLIGRTDTCLVTYRCKERRGM